MDENEDKQLKKVARLMNEEKAASDHFEDLLRKYRIIIPYVSSRSEILEKKIERLLEHREESERNAGKIKLSLQKTARKIESLKSEMCQADAEHAELTKQYAKMLEGSSTGAHSFSADSSLEKLKDEKKKYLSGISEAFSGIEGKMQGLEETKSKLFANIEKASISLEGHEEKLEMVNHKISLYKDDIRKQLMEFNDHLKSERKLKKEYVLLIKQLKKIPDLSEPAKEIFKKALMQTQAGVKIMELKAPVGGKQAALY